MHQLSLYHHMYNASLFHHSKIWIRIIYICCHFKWSQCNIIHQPTGNTHTHTYMRKHPPTHPSCITLIQAWYETVFCKLVTLYNMWMWDTFSLSSTLPAEKVCIFKKHVFSATTLYPFLKCPIYFFCGKTYVPSFSILGLNTVPSLTVLKENNKQNKTKRA